MHIERIFPQVIGGKSTLGVRLRAECLKAAMSAEATEDLVSIVPPVLLRSGCFLDNLSPPDTWRYEFQTPSVVNGQALWGTSVWKPVQSLFRVLQCLRNRLSAEERERYLERLVNPDKHEDALMEFLPVLRLDQSIGVDFEYPTGVGNRNVDWRIRPDSSRPILIDVKNRIRDLYEMLAGLDLREGQPNNNVPAPTHDVALLFRGIEAKLPSANPDEQLQGVWIHTNVQQEGTELTTAFNALDATKIHFAIFGGWEPGISILSRRDEDRFYLCHVLQEHESPGFSFSRSTT